MQSLCGIGEFSFRGPIRGVTNGSQAKPGEVGEYYLNQQEFPFTATQQVLTVRAGMLTAGDWECVATVWADVLTTGISFQLATPVPEGIMTGMGGAIIETQGSGFDPEDVVVHSQPSAAFLKALTPFDFTVRTNPSPGPAGNFFIAFQARRMR